MIRIFISYSHQDGSDVAELFYSRLMGCGYSVWKDDHSLIPGSSFPREISDAVEDGDCFIVILTQGALGSHWVQDEIDMAITAHRKIIPVLPSNITPPLYMRKIQSILMKQVNDWQALDKLVNALEDGRSIPRVYNMSGHKDIEVDGLLVLGHSEFKYPSLNDPAAIVEAAQTLAQSALPFINAGAGIVPHGHPALACAILAYWMGTNTRLPTLYNTYRIDSKGFGISRNQCFSLQDLREMGFEYRTHL